MYVGKAKATQVGSLSLVNAFSLTKDKRSSLLRMISQRNILQEFL